MLHSLSATAHPFFLVAGSEHWTGSSSNGEPCVQDGIWPDDQRER